VGPATEGLGDRRSGAAGYGWGLATLVAAWLAVIGAGIVLVSQAKLDQSRSAARDGHLDEAARDADTASRVEPWAAAPRLQLALVRERRGAIPSALEANAKALEKAPNDWRIWLTESRLRTKAGDIPAARRALDRARELNPRSPIFATLR
jgi:tetratricopeptide (TPR) repeat protein